MSTYSYHGVHLEGYIAKLHNRTGATDDAVQVDMGTMVLTLRGLLPCTT